MEVNIGRRREPDRNLLPTGVFVVVVNVVEEIAVVRVAVVVPETSDTAGWDRRRCHAVFGLSCCEGVRTGR